MTYFGAAPPITTPSGPRDIVQIAVGDRVETASGPSPVRWVGRRHITCEQVLDNPKLRPIRIMVRALSTQPSHAR